METKRLRLSDLKLAGYNPRKDLRPGDDEYEKLKRSIEEFGYVSPIIVNKTNNTIIGGHQRYKILKELGHEEADVVLTELDEQHEKILNIALNKISGDWDMEKLESLLQEFKELDFDATLTGFNTDEINDLIGDFDPFKDDSDGSSNEDTGEKDTMVVCPKCQHVAEKEEFKI